MDDIASDLSELDNLINSFESSTADLAAQRVAAQREVEERKQRDREREAEEQRRKEEQKRRADEQKQQSLRQWEEQRDKIKAAEELLRQRQEADDQAKAQRVEQQQIGKKEISYAGKDLIQALDHFEKGDYARENAVALVAAIQKLNSNIPLVFPPFHSDDTTRSIVEVTLKEIIAMVCFPF